MQLSQLDFEVSQLDFCLQMDFISQLLEKSKLGFTSGFLGEVPEY